MGIRRKKKLIILHIINTPVVNIYEGIVSFDETLMKEKSNYLKNPKDAWNIPAKKVAENAS